MYGGGKCLFRVLVGKPWKTLRRRWENNIKTELQEVGWGDMDWVDWLRIGIGGGHL